MPHTRAGAAAALALALVVACVCVAPSAAAAGLPARCANATEIVIGQSAGASQIERGAAEGLLAAYTDAKRFTTLPLRLVQLTHADEAGLMANVKRLAEEECAFVIAATTADAATEPALLGNLSSYGVPLVGSLSASLALRDVDGLAINFARTSGKKVTLPYVVNVRASATDELNAVLSVLAQDWSTLPRVSFVAADRALDKAEFEYVNNSLATLTGTSGVLSQAYLGTEALLTAERLDAVESDLFGAAAPRAVVVYATPNVTAKFVSRLARTTRAQARDLALYFVSWASAEDLDARLDSETRSLLSGKNIAMYFTQNMPTPAVADADTDIPLLSKFVASAARKTRSALEGYLTGWFLYEAIQQAGIRNALLPTRGDLLNAVFEDVRTFNVQGMTLGPYGDGGTTSASTQGTADACNQGVHEVFLTQYFPSNGTLAQISGATAKFAGCTAPKWSSGSTLTVVGSLDETQSSQDSTSRSGVIAAVNAHNAEGENAVLLRSVKGNISAVAAQLQASKVVVVAQPKLSYEADADLLNAFALIAPIPGFWGLRHPFNRRGRPRSLPLPPPHPR
eukprot:m51a1_g8833 hypothetical protein (569) ;mRNA; r:399990-401978